MRTTSARISCTLNHDTRIREYSKLYTARDPRMNVSHNSSILELAVLNSPCQTLIITHLPSLEQTRTRACRIHATERTMRPSERSLLALAVLLLSGALLLTAPLAAAQPLGGFPWSSASTVRQGVHFCRMDPSSQHSFCGLPYELSNFQGEVKYGSCQLCYHQRRCCSRFVYNQG